MKTLCVKEKEISLPLHPVLWERKIVVVSAVVVSSKKQIPRVEERTVWPFLPLRAFIIIGLDYLGGTSIDRVVLSEGRSVGGGGGAVRGALGGSFLAEDLVNLVAEALSAVGGGAVCGASGAGLVAELVGHGASVANVLGAADAAFSYVVGLAGDLRGMRDVRGGGSRAELEDW